MLKGFTVIELVKPITNLTVIIDTKKVRFVKSCVDALEYCPYVHFLLDPDGKRFAVQASDKDDPQAMRFAKSKDEQGENAVILQSAALINALSTMLPKADDTPRYAIDGSFVKSEKAIIFDLESAVPYRRGMRPGK